MLQHLFFDLDRTLWDFDTNSQRALRVLFDQTKDRHRLSNFYQFAHSYKEINIDLWRKFGKGKIDKEQLRTTRFHLTFHKLGIEDEELSNFFCVEYLRVSPLQTNLLPNAKTTLATLKEQGYSLHIITNGFKEVQTNKLINSSLMPFFDVVVSSEDVGVTKPHQQIFLHALTHAGATPQQSVMIGDDMRVDVLGARQVGMNAIHFDSQQRFNRSKNYRRIHNLNELPHALEFINHEVAKV